MDQIQPFPTRSISGSKMLDFFNNSKQFMQLDRQFHTRICELSGCIIK